MKNLKLFMDYVLTYGVIFASVFSILTCIVVEEIKAYQRNKAKELNKMREQKQQEIEAKLLIKRRAFEEYRAYIESSNQSVDIKEVSVADIDIKEVNYSSGINELRKLHNYRPYVTNDFDIRDTLREFTVHDVINMFY